MDMEELPCNTLDGVKEYLRDLDGLNRLMEDRRKAAKDKEGNFRYLREFMIMGRWSTDSCGNFGDMTLLNEKHRPLEEDIAIGLPRVLERDEFFRIVKSMGVESISVNGMRCCIPPVRVHCRECGNKWNIDNAHDSVITTDTFKVEMGPYIGRTFRDLDNDVRAKDDGSHFIGPDLPLKHERFIDITPHPTIEGLVENRDGWVDLGNWSDEHRARDPAGFLEFVGLVDQPEFGLAGGYDPWRYVFRDGDYTYGHSVFYTHFQCLKLKKSRESREYYVALFKEAGFPEPVTEEVPNERFSGPDVTPWIVGKFPFGNVKVGWRASVLSIDWSGMAGSPDYSSLFDDVQSTKWAHGVHANTRALAVEYLSRLKMALDAGLRCDRDCPNPPVCFYTTDVGIECFCKGHDVTVSGSRKRVSFLEAVVAKIHST